VFLWRTKLRPAPAGLHGDRTAQTGLADGRCRMEMMSPGDQKIPRRCAAGMFCRRSHQPGQGLAREFDCPNRMETLAETSRKSRCDVQDRGNLCESVLRRQIPKCACPEITSSNPVTDRYDPSQSTHFEWNLALTVHAKVWWGASF
jgi:hypothetical protein